MYQENLKRALELLENNTPLSTDCGLLCDNCCCKDNGEAGSGVWLLPGEDTAAMTWGKILPLQMPFSGKIVPALYCSSPCNRAYRPFLCRIFPLTPYYSAKKECWDVRMDRRAAALCPLFAFGKKGLRTEFVENARKAVSELAKSEEGLSALKTLESEETAFRISL